MDQTPPDRAGPPEPEPAPHGARPRPRPRPGPPAGGPGPEPEPEPAERTATPGEQTAERPRGLRRAVTTVLALGGVIAAALLLRALVVAPFYIPSASMEPTLHGCPTCDDDHVLVDKLAYHLHAVHRGDVVVFDRPSTWAVHEAHLVKRVIGLPGDVLTVRHGRLYVNGRARVEPYLAHDCGPLTSLGEGPAAPRDRYGPVPAGDVFVMGDNRCDSADSRAFGPVPESDIVGRAFVIVWPLSRLRYL
jgi:signal peptidase I